MEVSKQTSVTTNPVQHAQHGEGGAKVGRRQASEREETSEMRPQGHTHRTKAGTCSEDTSMQSSRQGAQ
eukprot:13649443-Alexandrium_andersonii.AAC.1